MLVGKLALENNAQVRVEVTENLRWDVLYDLQMALMVFSFSDLEFSHTLDFQIHSWKGKDPGATGFWLPV